MPDVSKQHSVPPVLPEEIAKAAEAVRALVQGEMDELMAENARLIEQHAALAHAARQYLADGSEKSAERLLDELRKADA